MSITRDTGGVLGRLRDLFRRTASVSGCLGSSRRRDLWHVRLRSGGRLTVEIKEWTFRPRSELSCRFVYRYGRGRPEDRRRLIAAACLVDPVGRIRTKTGVLRLGLFLKIGKLPLNVLLNSLSGRRGFTWRRKDTLIRDTISIGVQGRLLLRHLLALLFNLPALLV